MKEKMARKINKKDDEYLLWNNFKKNNNKEAFDNILKKYLPLVKYQAGRIKLSIPDFIDEDDLISYGVEGLIDAMNKFDLDKGVKFSTYASLRIRGSIMDYLRDMDWLPRSLRRKSKIILENKKRLHNELRRNPTVEELANATGYTKEKIKNINQKVYSSQWVSLNNIIDGSDSEISLESFLLSDDKNIPDIIYQDKEIEKVLIKNLNKLKEKEKIVIALIYYEELTIKEVSKVLGLTNARISQIHKKAIRRLRGYLSRKKNSLV